jgi:hypothetical protein
MLWSLESYSKRRQKTGRTGRRRFSGIFEHFSGFEFFLFPNIVHARPTASNTDRWAIRCEK